MSLVALSLLLIAVAPRRVVRSTPWLRPACDTVRGLDVITFSDGVTTSDNELPAPRNVYVTALVALDTPNTLMAAANFDIWISRDSGCTWGRIASIFGAGTMPSITPAAGGSAWVWTDTQLFRYDGGTFELRSTPEPIRYVVADPHDSKHVRFFGDSGTMWDSRSGGSIWASDLPSPQPAFLYDVAVDPTNFDHMIRSTMATAQMTTNGGLTWTTVAMPRANFFDVVFSAHDPRVVWASGVSLDTLRNTIYRSTDGGRTFAAIFEPPQGLNHDRNVLVPRFGGVDIVSFLGSYELFTYDHRDGSLKELKSPRGGIVRALESPADAGLVYIAASDFIIVG